MLNHLARFLAPLVDLTVYEMEEWIDMGIRDGLTVKEIVGILTDTKHVSFADMVADERRFLADHEWSEKRTRFFRRKNLQSTGG